MTFPVLMSQPSVVSHALTTTSVVRRFLYASDLRMEWLWEMTFPVLMSQPSVVSHALTTTSVVRRFLYASDLRMEWLSVQVKHIASLQGGSRHKDANNDDIEGYNKNMPFVSSSLTPSLIFGLSSSSQMHEATLVAASARQKWLPFWRSQWSHIYNHYREPLVPPRKEWEDMCHQTCIYCMHVFAAYPKPSLKKVRSESYKKISATICDIWVSVGVLTANHCSKDGRWVRAGGTKQNNLCNPLDNS